jgi:hypothetical protein
MYMRPISHAVKHLVEACTINDVAGAMNDLYYLNQLLVEQSKSRDIWVDSFFAGVYVAPLLHRFLSIRKSYTGRNPVLRREGLCQTGAILYLATIRCRFGISIPANIHIGVLRDLWTFQNAERLKYDGLAVQLWLLAIGEIQCTTKEDYKWFVSELAQTIVDMRCVLWEEVLSYVKRVLWIPDLFDIRYKRLYQDVCIKLLVCYSYVFL